MAFRFLNKKFLITGADRGLGRHLAITLANAGAEVYAICLNSSTLDTPKQQFPSITTLRQDLSKWHETRALLKQLDPVDGLVNNAAVLPKGSVSALDVDFKDLDINTHTNLYSAINCTQIVARAMIDSKKAGSIVNVSSIGSTGAIRGTLPYAMSKAGLDMVTKQFALELGVHNIRVNSLLPTMFVTEAQEELVKNISSFDSKFVSRTPMKRLPSMTEVINPILYLLSDESSMVTGSLQIIDGGLLSTIFD